ncbi:MAG: dihydroorotase [Lachnospiraceae bacterium]|nr:dihydroorotase [Lachnospiraceae bacterium]
MTGYRQAEFIKVGDISKLPAEFDPSRFSIFPGFCDVHVHFREPGFSYKETITTGCQAASHGGYVTVLTMPNLDPVPDTKEHLQAQLSLIEKEAEIEVLPYGSITVEEKGAQLSQMEELADAVIAFSDDGKGVQSERMMEEAMRRAKDLGKIIVAHCEDNSLLHGGYIHDGIYAKTHGHKGICSESEWGPIKRDLALVQKTGCSYHVCHISTKESVDVIRAAKKNGVDVTCETAPHYLLLNENDLQEDGRFKMNPPLRSREDQDALIEGIQDGTIDMIATDHAPHSKEEKARGLKDSAFGIVGLESAFPLLYTYLVRKEIIPLDKLIDLMAVNPRKRFGIPMGDSYTVWDLQEQYEIDPKDFFSKGKATPFEGWKVYGRNYLTVCNGKTVYHR